MLSPIECPFFAFLQHQIPTAKAATARHILHSSEIPAADQLFQTSNKAPIPSCTLVAINTSQITHPLSLRISSFVARLFLGRECVGARLFAVSSSKSPHPIDFVLDIVSVVVERNHVFVTFLLRWWVSVGLVIILLARDGNGRVLCARIRHQQAHHDVSCAFLSGSGCSGPPIFVQGTGGLLDYGARSAAYKSE